MLHTLQAFLRYLAASKNQYGVHSPLVYDYLIKGLNSSEKIDLSKVTAYRKDMENNMHSIEVTDYGAGSKVLKGHKRKVSDIARKAAISKKRGKLLYKSLTYFKPDRMLEIGTSLGIATAYMAAARPEAEITTLEGCPAVAGIATQQFKKYGFDHIDPVIGNFEDTLDQVLKNQRFDLIYFDGNHQKEATIRYFEKCLKTAHENSIFIFDDIHWTRGMEDAWEFIRKHEKVTLSLDTFKWGLVFFKTGRAKEHFTLRI